MLDVHYPSILKKSIKRDPDTKRSLRTAGLEEGTLGERDYPEGRGAPGRGFSSQGLPSGSWKNSQSTHSGSPWEGFLFPRPSLCVLEKLPNDTQPAVSPLSYHRDPSVRLPRGSFVGWCREIWEREAHPLSTAGVWEKEQCSIQGTVLD